MKIYFYSDSGKAAILGPFTGIKIEYCQHMITKEKEWNKEPIASYEEAYGWTINKGMLSGNSYSNFEVIE